MAETRRIECDGVGLHVELDGPDDAATVLFLHGVGSSGRTWEWLPDELTRGRRIVRVDLRGHGRSDHAPGTYVVPRYGADVAAVLRSVASRPAVVVGNSLGGVIAWWLAQNHPETGHRGAARGPASVRRRDPGDAKPGGSGTCSTPSRP